MWKTKDHNVSETGSVSVLRWIGQDRLRVFENRVLRRIFWPKRDEVTGG
jgi:hypothetical protein